MLFETPTVAGLAAQIAAIDDSNATFKISGRGQNYDSASIENLSAALNGLNEDDDEINRLLAELENISDEEVQRLIASQAGAASLS
jgi:hypothetical protein